MNAGSENRQREETCAEGNEGYEETLKEVEKRKSALATGLIAKAR